MSGTKKHEHLFHPCQAMPPITSVSDKNFLQSLSDYIQSEKEYLQCPENGSDEQRYIIYSTAFDKVSKYLLFYLSVYHWLSFYHYKPQQKCNIQA